MGISKKALDELNKSKETSVEALKPLKEAIVQIAVSKDFNKLKAVSEEALLNSTLSSLSYSTLQKLIDTGVIQSASSAKIRSFAQELSMCYSPANVSILPERALRDIVASNWKEMSEMFPLEGPVMTYGGARVTRASTAFAMVVENTPEVRRYLRYCQKVVPNNVGVMITPIPVSLASLQQKLWKHQFNPSHGRSSSSLGSCSLLWSCKDKELDALYRVFYSEAAWILKNWSTLQVTRPAYHSHHSLSNLLETAKQRTLQSIFVGAFPGRMNHTDYASQLADRTAEFRALAGGAAELDSRRQSYPKILQNVTADGTNTLMPLFQEIYSNLAKNNRTAADKAAVETGELVRNLESPVPFLLVSMEYVNSRAFVDKDGKHRNSLLEDLKYYGFSNFRQVFDTVGVNLDQVVSKSLRRPTLLTAEANFLRNLEQELRLPLSESNAIMGDGGLRSVLGRGLIASPERVIRTLTQITTIFNTLQRKNLWMTSLKQQRS